MNRSPEDIRSDRVIAKGFNWRPIETPTTELILRVIKAFEAGMDTVGMAKLWGWSEAVCERALHIGLERRRLARRKADEEADQRAEAAGRLADAMGANV